MKRLRLYWRLMTLFYQEAFQYRGESFIWFLFDVLPPLVMVILWRAAYEDVSQIGGYTPSQMMLYYVGLTTFQALLTSHPEWDISYEIRMGEFSKHLLRPLRFNTYHLIGELAWKGLRLMFVTPILIAAILWMGTGIFSAVALRAGTVLSFLLSLVMSYILAYFLKASLGLTAFWVIESYGVIILFEFLRTFFAGVIIPLDMMPSSIKAIGDRLPFASLYFFPLSLLQGKLGDEAILDGLLVQGGWCVASYLLMKMMYRLGVRKYSAIGG
jgi:ABC-2 type transport system permease protein